MKNEIDPETAKMLEHICLMRMIGDAVLGMSRPLTDEERRSIDEFYWSQFEPPHPVKGQEEG